MGCVDISPYRGCCGAVVSLFKSALIPPLAIPLPPSPSPSPCPSPSLSLSPPCTPPTRWVPVLVISGIVAWSYYAYVAELCIKNVESDAVKVVFLVGYHIVLTLFLASYWRTVWTRPGISNHSLSFVMITDPSGDIPKKFRLTADELDSVEGSEDVDVQKQLLEQIVIDKDLPVAMRTIQGAVRYCEKCATIKPDRAHHCSVCGTCVLKVTT
jgi:palmitoyltransferase